MKLKYIFILVFSVLMGYLVIHRINANKAETAGRGKNPQGRGGEFITTVNGYVIEPQKFTNEITINGSIQANEQVDLKSQIAGIVEQLNFKEGSEVKKGQRLVKIEDSELRARLLEAKTREGLAQEAEQRAKLLLEKEAISKEEYEIATADFKSFKAQSQLIQAQLDKTSIVAPFSGRIGLRSISEGVYLTPDIVITSLVDTDPVKITFSVPEKYAGMVEINSTLQFNVAGVKETQQARVYAKEPAVNVQTRTIQIKATAPNPENKILPGSYATVNLALNVIEKAILIPTESIIPIQNGKKVFAMSKGKAKEVTVTTSTRTGNKILVTSGLNPGDTIITSGIMTIKNDMPLKVIIEKAK